MSSDLIEGKNGEMPYLKANEYFMKLVKYGVTNFRDMLDIISLEASNNHNNTNKTHKSNNSDNSSSKAAANGTSTEAAAKTEEFSFAFFKSTLASILGSMNINSLFYGYLQESDLEIMKNNINKFIGTSNPNEGKKNSNAASSSTNSS